MQCKDNAHCKGTFCMFAVLSEMAVEDSSLISTAAASMQRDASAEPSAVTEEARPFSSAAVSVHAYDNASDSTNPDEASDSTAPDEASDSTAPDEASDSTGSDADEAEAPSRVSASQHTQPHRAQLGQLQMQSSLTVCCPALYQRL